MTVADYVMPKIPPIVYFTDTQYTPSISRLPVYKLPPLGTFVFSRTELVYGISSLQFSSIPRFQQGFNDIAYEP